MIAKIRVKTISGDGIMDIQSILIIKRVNLFITPKAILQHFQLLVGMCKTMKNLSHSTAYILSCC